MTAYYKDEPYQIKDSKSDQMELSLATSVLPKPDHIIFGWMENKDYSQIIGSSSAPFINSLISQGTTFTNSHAIGSISYPEYICFLTYHAFL